MEDLFINSTASTPVVDFKICGEINLEGRSLPEDSVRFYQPLFEWTKKLKAENVAVNIKLEYINTSSSKQILTLLKILTEKDDIKQVNINWYYEEGDLDGLETGEHYSTIIDAPFKFIEYAETETL